jgi:hypothetical protein
VPDGPQSNRKAAANLDDGNQVIGLAGRANPGTGFPNSELQGDGFNSVARWTIRAGVLLGVVLDRPK